MTFSKEEIVMILKWYSVYAQTITDGNGYVPETEWRFYLQLEKLANEKGGSP